MIFKIHIAAIVYYVPRRTMRVIARRALARILFYVTSVRIRVFMRALESILCSSSGF